MKLIKNILCATAILSLIGCELTGPSVKVEPPKVKIDGVKVESTNTESSKDDGKFCPPGQAKKGNC